MNYACGNNHLCLGTNDRIAISVKVTYKVKIGSTIE